MKMNYAKKLLKSLGRIPKQYEDTSGCKHICLLTTRRSGGTWLMEAISTTKGMRYVNQPFSRVLYHYPDLRRNYFSGVSSNDLVPISDEDKNGVLEYMKDIIQQEVNKGTEWLPTRTTYGIKEDRLCLKIHNVKHWVEILQQEFDFLFLFLFRHPISVVKSVLKKQWSCFPESYLKDSILRSKLSKYELENSLNIIEKGSRLENYFLHWFIENIVPFRVIKDIPDAFMLSYEELLINTRDIVNIMGKRLDIGDTSTIVDTLKKPSNTSSQSTQKIIRDNNEINKKYKLLSKYVLDATDKEVSAYRRICNIFDIDVYKDKRLMPVDDYIISDSTFKRLSDIER